MSRTEQVISQNVGKLLKEQERTNTLLEALLAATKQQQVLLENSKPVVLENGADLQRG